MQPDGESNSCEMKTFVQNNISKTITREQFASLEKPITQDEISTALFKMANSRSPGSTGYPAGFFKFFYPDIKEFMWRSIQYSLSTNSLPNTQREAVITLIPKSNGLSNRVKGWRPISLLNVQYKMLSSVMASRLKTVAQHLINRDQTAYLKGRYIGENTRALYDVIEYCHGQKKDGAILSVDFEDAFNSLNWEYTKCVFKTFGFGEKFMKIFELLYTNENSFSRILLNGHLGEKIMIKRGVRQGDPAAGLIFIIAVEILANLLRKAPFRGIKIGEYWEFKISHYADD